MKKIHPGVRFRQMQYGDRATAERMGSKTKSRRAKILIGPFTSLGLTLFLATVFFAVFSVWFFIFSPFFLVNTIHLNQATSLSRGEIEKAFNTLKNQNFLLFIPANHMVLINREKLRRAFNAFRPQIGQISDFKKEWPNKISLSLVEEEPVFLAKNKEAHRYLLSDKGIVIGEVGESLPNGIILIDTTVPHNLKLGEKLPETVFLDFILSLQRSWPPEWELRPVRFQISDRNVENELSIYTNEDWFVKIDSDDNAQETLNNIDLLLINEINTDAQRKQLSYIDLRISGRAFYCLRTEPCAEAPQ